MQKPRCSSSALGAKTKDGVLMVETHTLRTALPYSATQNTGLELISSRNIPQYYFQSVVLAGLQMV